MPSPEINIQKIATLSRLSLTEAEAKQYEQQLGGILSYIDKLSTYDLGDAEPTAHAVPVYDVLRVDVPRPSFTQEEALSNAPKRSSDQFQIPKVIE